MMDPLGLLFENGGLSAGGVLAAVVAALITYMFNAHLDRQAQRRAARLQFVQDQLRLLYGPLYAITRANETIYAMRAGSGSFQPGDNPGNAAWTAAVFQPSNLRMRETIELNAHLFETATLPDYVIAFLAHVENWQAILSSAAGAVSQADEIAPYPEDFSRRIEEAYLDVARRHTKLVGKVRGRGLQKLS